MPIDRYFNLQLQAGRTVQLVINVSQYDSGETWHFTLLHSDGTKYVPASAAIVGKKSDGNLIANACTVSSDGIVEVTETEQMTAAAGKAEFELLIDNQTHGTCNFIVLVEASPTEGGVESESDLSLIQQAIDSTSATAIAQGVADWMDDNLTPTTPVVDASLTVQGAAADAKKTGDEISELKSEIESSTGMTDDFKIALENLVNHLLFDDNDPTGQTYITALHDAMYPPAQLVSISAVYGGGSVVQGTSINDLKDDLTVTGLFDDESTEIIASSDYTLSGDLNTVGTSTITVAYEEQTTTFTVTVEEGEALLYELASAVSTKNYDTGIKLWSPEPISHTVLCESTFANSGWSGKQAVISHGNQSNDRQYRVGHDSTLNYKTALLIGAQGVSLFAGSSSTKRRFAYSYNATTGEVKAYSKNSGGEISALKTFTAGTVNASEDTLTLNSGVTGTTNPVSVLRVYGKVLSEQDMYDFVDALE